MKCLSTTDMGVVIQFYHAVWNRVADYALRPRLSPCTFQESNRDPLVLLIVVLPLHCKFSLTQSRCCMSIHDVTTVVSLSSCLSIINHRLSSSYTQNWTVSFTGTTRLVKNSFQCSNVIFRYIFTHSNTRSPCNNYGEYLCFEFWRSKVPSLARSPTLLTQYFIRQIAQSIINNHVTYNVPCYMFRPLQDHHQGGAYKYSKFCHRCACVELQHDVTSVTACKQYGLNKISWLRFFVVFLSPS
jgi:hypothetical protein